MQNFTSSETLEVHGLLRACPFQLTVGPVGSVPAETCAGGGNKDFGVNDGVGDCGTDSDC